MSLTVGRVGAYVGGLTVTSLDRSIDVLVTQHLSKCHGRPAADRNKQRGNVSVAGVCCCQMAAFIRSNTSESTVPPCVNAPGTKQLSALPISGRAEPSAVISHLPPVLHRSSVLTPISSLRFKGLFLSCCFLIQRDRKSVV